MAKVLITYYSRGGNTSRMAELMAETVKVNGHEVTLKKTADTTPEDMFEADGILIGSPTYFGQMAAPVKELIDDSIKYFRKLDGKVGGAFTTSGGLAGGNETTLLSIIEAMLVHGMIVQGDPGGDHYGPVAVRAPDGRAKEEAVRHAERFAALLTRLGL